MALNSPKLASISWYKNHAPRKIQAGMRTRKHLESSFAKRRGQVGQAEQQVTGDRPAVALLKARAACRPGAMNA